MAKWRKIQPSKRRKGGPTHLVESVFGETTHHGEEATKEAWRQAELDEMELGKPDVHFETLAQEATNAIRASVAESTGGNLNQHLQPLLDEFKTETARDLKTERLERARNKMPLGEPRKRRMSLLNRILQFGVAKGVFSVHPAIDMEDPPLPPTVDTPTRNPSHYLRMPSIDHLKLILSKIPPGRLSDLVYLTLFGGLRPGEAQALEYSDYLVTKAELSVNKTWSYKEGTKTKSSDRFLELPDQLIEYLDSIIDVRKPSPFDPIIVDANGARPNPDLLRDEFYQFQVSIGIGEQLGFQIYRGVYSPNQLRHAASALMIWAGVLSGTLAKWLGHANPRMVLETYSYLFDHYDAGDAVWPIGDAVNDEI